MYRGIKQMWQTCNNKKARWLGVFTVVLLQFFCSFEFFSKYKNRLKNMYSTPP